MVSDAKNLQRIYHHRFSQNTAYRHRVWQVLTTSYFSRWVAPDAAVLDLGCGYGEFINNIEAQRKYALDLNPDTSKYLNSEIKFIEQDCSSLWPLDSSSLDAVFTSNFFEHLESKVVLQGVLRQILRCLKPEGRLIAMGPNIKYLPGLYWDFFDHHLPLSENSLREALEIEGYCLEQVVPRFLPYSLNNSPEYPLIFLKLYLATPWLWWIKGRQFLLVARKPRFDSVGSKQSY